MSCVNLEEVLCKHESNGKKPMKVILVKRNLKIGIIGLAENIVGKRNTMKNFEEEVVKDENSVATEKSI